MNQMYRQAKGARINLTAMAHLWNDQGLSASEIAAHIGGLSRAAVLGYVHRNKDLFKSRAKKNLYKRTGGVKPEKRDLSVPHPAPALDGHIGQKIHNIHKARIEAARREAAEFDAGTAELLKIAPMDELRLPMGKELTDLAPHDCRWPLNNGSPFIFCAASQFQGSAYCAHHMLRSMPKQAVEA